jgi:hypothetical protein
MDRFENLIQGRIKNEHSMERVDGVERAHHVEAWVARLANRSEACAVHAGTRWQGGYCEHWGKWYLPETLRVPCVHRS